jgi:hypothetical protein
LKQLHLLCDGLCQQFPSVKFEWIEPTSFTRPSSNTTIWSACFIVDSQCAMISTVRDDQ